MNLLQHPSPFIVKLRRYSAMLLSTRIFADEGYIDIIVFEVFD